MHVIISYSRRNIIRSIVLLSSSLTADPLQMTSIALIGLLVRNFNEVESVSNVIGVRELVMVTVLLVAIGAFALLSTPVAFLSVFTTQHTITLTINSEMILNWMNHSLLYEYGKPVAVEVTQSLDKIQQKADCCDLESIIIAVPMLWNFEWKEFS
ncbi:hypothetical protein DICVIV_13340 [Dictyocaulus viviparus]|uniref:Uncharacterized protein n=1 Tax=Dictyocaulus viviparus TaxID=29172 RepID=A0A0D8X832_DICVI|nr:hypothetical protein DICVIV_13340 [Dictyocaulus viviparus]